MKIIIFGVGEVYRQNKDRIDTGDEVAAFIDNNVQIQGKKIDGKEVYSPLKISGMLYDKIILMSDYSVEMRNQLLSMGCSRKDMMHYKEYLSSRKKGEMIRYHAENQRRGRKKCVIITSSLGYHGGAITAAYAALALQDEGYEVTIAAPDQDIRFINEFQKKGIHFLIYPNLSFARRDEFFWLDGFEKIIVNTYPMMLCALEIGRYRDVLVWLHESDCVYAYMDFWKEDISRKLFSDNLHIYAVSSVARNNFYKNVTNCKMGLLRYGIPDLCKDNAVKKEALTFAVIGTIFPIKQQLLYIEAIGKLDKRYQMCSKFLIIGSAGDVEYAKRVQIEVEKMQNVDLINELERNELEKQYKNIDVFVIAAAQEAMSLVATEAMMYGKICIVCDAAGMAEFIQHEKNGLVYKTGDVNSLAEQMTFCIENRDMLDAIGTHARTTYCQYFTMGMFRENLKEALSGGYDEKCI